MIAGDGITQPSRASSTGLTLVSDEQSRGDKMRRLALPALGIMFVVVLSNVLVQFPINRWVTRGVFVYPVGYLISELTNRWAGPAQARLVAWVGFGVAAVLSSILGNLTIALASTSALLVC